MRKWMRDRLQRRKKSPATPSEQPAPPPLQPAYFDAEAGADAPVAEEREAENHAAEVPAAPAFEAEDQPVSSAQSGGDEAASEGLPASPQPTGRSSSTAGRSTRRRRGGRGRGGSGGRGREQAVAQAFAPAAVKGSIPVLPVGTDDEEVPVTDGAEEADGADQTPEAVVAALPKAPVISAAPPRPLKGVVVLAIGLPGSGKSSWFKRHNIAPLSSDMVRSLLFDDVREQRFQDLVFSNLRSMLKARLIAKRPTNYVDATNLTPQERQHWIKLAKDYQ
ncbi:MAG: AAA family ATPase, partial [Candidatus Sulfotelmatobacter sp.]